MMFKAEMTAPRGPDCNICFQALIPAVADRIRSTMEVNCKTGDHAKTHEQFRDRKRTWEEVIHCIARHEKGRAGQNEAAENKKSET